MCIRDRPGRLESFSREGEPLAIIDGAHNADGARALKEAVTDYCRGKRLLMVTGMLADKDIEGITGNFCQITGDFIVTEPDNPRRLEAAKLAGILRSKGCRCTLTPDIEEAYREACRRKDDYDVIIYAGSLYMIGKIRTMIRKGDM